MQLESVVHYKGDSNNPHAITHNILVNGKVETGFTIFNKPAPAGGKVSAKIAKKLKYIDYLNK